MKGNLLAAGLDKVVYRVQLNAAGTAVVSKRPCSATWAMARST